MKRIVQVAEGAFFVPSYTEQTVLPTQTGITTQAGITTVCVHEMPYPATVVPEEEMVKELIEDILVERAPAWRELAKR